MLHTSNMFYCIKLLTALIILVLVYSIVKKNLTTSEHQLANHNNDSSFCGRNNCLDGNNFDYNNSAIFWTMVTPKQVMSRLHSYTLSDVVNCFDSINALRGDSSTSNVVFIGDSRVRQQFFNFLKFIPDFDCDFGLKLDSNIQYIKRNQIDRFVFSPLLGLNVSFFWRPKLDHGNWMDLIQEWLKHPPHLIVISVGLHHLQFGYDQDLQIFKNVVTQLLPSLRLLANRGSEIIWLNQYPILSFQRYFGWDKFLTSESIQALNNLVRQLLTNSGVMLWDSGNLPVEEYVRACDHYQRTDRSLVNEDQLLALTIRSFYFDCQDMGHPGYVALYHATQILLNHLCNRFLL